MKTILCSGTVALAVVAFLLAPNSAGASDGDLNWTGCGITKKAFMAEAAAVYEKQTGKKIALSGGGASLGIRKAASGEAHIGGSCRPCKPDLTDEEQGVRMTHVAWDALVVMVHPNNPVDSLTTAQLRGIFKGEIRNWKEVGGSDEPIVVVARRGKVNGVGYMARKMIFGDEKASFYKRTIRLKSSGPVEKKVEETENAIALSGVSSARKRQVKLLSLDGGEPTKDNIASGSYPLFRPLFLMTKGEPSGDVKDFLDWLLTEDGQQLISEQQTVNLAEGASLFSKFNYWEHTDLIVNYQGPK